MAVQRKPRIGPLDSVAACRREMGRVYRLARYGEIPTKDLSRYVYALKSIADTLVSADFERRLDVLETEQADSPPVITNGAPYVARH